MRAFLLFTRKSCNTHIAIHYPTSYQVSETNKDFSPGNYKVDLFEYEIDQIIEAVRIVKIACDKLIRDNVNKVTLRKVIYNETNEITEKVRELYIARK